MTKRSVGDVAQSVRAGYDSLAESYARRYNDELASKPLDRELLRRSSGALDKRGDVCEFHPVGGAIPMVALHWRRRIPPAGIMRDQILADRGQALAQWFIRASGSRPVG